MTTPMATRMGLPFMEPLHILGAGSIGLLWAASIRGAFPSYPLAVILRGDDISSKEERMICLLQQNRPRMVPIPVQGVWSNGRKIKHLLLTTKAFSAAAAVESILPRLNHDESSTITVLCNGAFAVEEELQSLLPSNISCKLILASTTHGAFRQEPQDDMLRIVHAGYGKTFVQEQPAVAQLWDQSGLNAQSISKDEMMTLLWKKLAANCAINPLTALHQCLNGELVESHNIVLQNVVREVAQIASLSCSSSADTSTLTFDSLWNFVETVIHDTARNKSSMLQDVLRQQTTEIDYLNGYIVHKGKEYGIETPANEALYQQIQDLTRYENTSSP